MNSIVFLSRPQSPLQQTKTAGDGIKRGVRGEAPECARRECSSEFRPCHHFERAVSWASRRWELRTPDAVAKKRISEFSRRVLVHDELLNSTVLKLVIVGVCVPDQKSWRGLSYPL